MSEEKGENLGMCGAHTRARNVEEMSNSDERIASTNGAAMVSKNEEEMAGKVGERLRGNKAVQEKARRVRDEVGKLAGMLEADEEQLDLLAGADELDDGDTLALAAETVAAPRRGRGRPKGAANVRNTRVFDYLEALGHRDPLVTLSLIQTADTRDLAQVMGIEAGEALRMQISAAKEMLPYKYAKKPQEFNVNEQRAHIFLTGTLDVGSDGTDDGTLSIFGNKIIDNQ